MIRSAMRYVADHWHGKHGLAWSFWINLVLIRSAVFLTQEWLHPEEGQDFHNRQLLVLLLGVLFHGVLFVWQVVGVIRASELHIRNSGFLALGWGVQLALVVSFLWVLSYVLDAWQMTIPAPEQYDTQTKFEAERASKYSVEVSDDGRVLIFTGSLELGAIKRFKALLGRHPTVEQVILASAGGNVFEARGLSKLIRQRGLNTLVITECSSACTTVFVGGVERQLAPGAKLGFHQYRIEADYAVLNANPLQEQERDRAVFLQSGVSDWFLEKMFDRNAADMWYPKLAELIDANVVTVE